MGYTLVIIKIRFENLTRILHFPNLTINYRIFFENKKQDVSHLCFMMEIDVVIYIFSNYFNSKIN